MVCGLKGLGIAEVVAQTGFSVVVREVTPDLVEKDLNHSRHLRCSSAWCWRGRTGRTRGADSAIMPTHRTRGRCSRSKKRSNSWRNLAAGDDDALSRHRPCVIAAQPSYCIRHLRGLN